MLDSGPPACDIRSCWNRVVAVPQCRLYCMQMWKHVTTFCRLKWYANMWSTCTTHTLRGCNCLSIGHVVSLLGDRVGGKNRAPLSAQDVRNRRAPSLTLKGGNDAKEKVEWTKSCTTLTLPKNNMERRGTRVLCSLRYRFEHLLVQDFLHPQYNQQQLYDSICAYSLVFQPWLHHVTSSENTTNSIWGYLKTVLYYHQVSSMSPIIPNHNQVSSNIYYS